MENALGVFQKESFSPSTWVKQEGFFLGSSTRKSGELPQDKIHKGVRTPLRLGSLKFQFSPHSAFNNSSLPVLRSSVFYSRSIYLGCDSLYSFVSPDFEMMICLKLNILMTLRSYWFSLCSSFCCCKGGSGWQVTLKHLAY